jgi:hypothetical protein
MRINIICPECSAAAGGIGAFFIDTIRADGLYTGKCPKGHDLLVATQTLRHEMLFDIALNAVADRYYREAVSSFAASIERYFEFAIATLASNRGVTNAVYDMAWKRVSSKSERQLGAYVFLYVGSFGEVPRLLSNQMIEMRNDVIHKGVLPEKRDALAFGAAAYEVIQSGIKKLRETCLNDVNKILGQHVAKIAEKMGDRYPRAFQVTPTALNIIVDVSAGYKPFDHVLRERGLEVS